LVQPTQAGLRVGVSRINRQHALQIGAPILQGLDDAAQPQPSLLVLPIQLCNAQQQPAGLLFSPGLSGGDSASQQF
jgi:hypothetical protein